MALRFWALLAAYFLSEMAFASFASFLGTPLAILPTSTAAGFTLWWLYLLLFRQTHHVRVDADALLGGLGSLLIILTLTMAYSLPGVSIMTPLVLMKNGGLAVALGVGIAQGARPSRRSILVALAVAAGLIAVMWSRLRLDGTAAALCCAVGYLLGYAWKLVAAGRRRGDWSFFVSMTTVAISTAFPVSLAICLAFGRSPSASPLALLAGCASQGCGVFGGLILLRGHAAEDSARGLTSHAALFPIHRAVSLLAGMSAMVCVAVARLGVEGAARTQIFSPGEKIGALLLIVAMWIGTRSPTSASSH